MNKIWCLDVSTKSRQDRYDRKINNKTIQSSAADIMKLNEYLKRDITCIVGNIDENPYIEDYDLLQKGF